MLKSEKVSKRPYIKYVGRRGWGGGGVGEGGEGAEVFCGGHETL